MRYPPEAIRQFLAKQSRSGLTVADFCADQDLKIPTFYSWKRKYLEAEPVEPQGFDQLSPRRKISERSLCLPSGLRLSVAGLSMGEIAELILEIDRAHA